MIEQTDTAGNRIRALEAEVARLQALVDGRFKDAFLLSAGPAPDGRGFEFAIRSGLGQVLAEQFLQILRQHDAPNFVELEANHEELGPLTFSVARRLGRSCGAQLAEAKASLAQLGDVLKKATEACDYHRLGYSDAQEFDANHMIHLMDQLALAVDACPEIRAMAPTMTPTTT